MEMHTQGFRSSTEVSKICKEQEEINLFERPTN